MIIISFGTHIRRIWYCLCCKTCHASQMADLNSVFKLHWTILHFFMILPTIILETFFLGKRSGLTIGQSSMVMLLSSNYKFVSSSEWIQILTFFKNTVKLGNFFNLFYNDALTCNYRYVFFFSSFCVNKSSWGKISPNQ